MNLRICRWQILRVRRPTGGELGFAAGLLGGKIGDGCRIGLPILDVVLHALGQLLSFSKFLGPLTGAGRCANAHTCCKAGIYAREKNTCAQVPFRDRTQVHCLGCLIFHSTPQGGKNSKD